MSNNSAPPQPFHVTAGDGDLSIQADYPITQVIRSSDQSVNVEKITEDGNTNPVSPYYELSLSIEHQEPLDGVLRIVQEKPGKYLLTLVPGARGFISASSEGKLVLTPEPSGKNSILVHNGTTIEWPETSSDNALFGVRDGQCHWFGIGTCDETCPN